LGKIWKLASKIFWHLSTFFVLVALFYRAHPEIRERHLCSWSVLALEEIHIFVHKIWKATCNQAYKLPMISWGTNHPKELLWLVGSISRKLTMGFLLFWFYFQNFFFQITILCFLLLLHLLLLLIFFSFSFLSFETKNSFYRFHESLSSFYRLPPCELDPHSRYAIADVLREAKATVFHYKSISMHWFSAQSNFDAVAEEGNGLFTNLFNIFFFVSVCMLKFKGHKYCRRPTEYVAFCSRKQQLFDPNKAAQTRQ